MGEAGTSFVLDRCLLIGQLLLLQFQVERLKLLKDLLLITRVRVQEGRNGVEWNKHRRGGSGRGCCTDRRGGGRRQRRVPFRCGQADG